MKIDKIKMGQFIAKLRKENKMTQDELGERLGVNGKSVSKWETGENIPSIYKLESLSQLYNVSINEILNGERIKKIQSEMNNSITIAIVKFYNKYLKQKFILIGTVILAIVIFLFSLLFLLANYNKNKVYSIYSLDKDLTISGYLIYNQKQNLIIINDIGYQNENYGTDDEKIKSLKIFINIGDNNMLLYEKDISGENNLLSDVLSGINFSISDSKNNDVNIINYNSDLRKINFIIEYTDTKNQISDIKVGLGFKKIFSNNKILY